MENTQPRNGFGKCLAAWAGARQLRSPALAVALMLGAAWTSSAAADIFRCEMPNGVVEYNNSATAVKDRNCKRVDLPQITTIPAPKLPVGGSGKPAGQGASKSPGDFPKVDPATQKARDSDRRQIIEDELKSEEGKLAALKKDYNGGEPERQGDERNYQKYLDRVQKMKEDISRSEANVDALRKELGNLKN